MAEKIIDIGTAGNETEQAGIISTLQGRNIILYGAGGIGYTTSSILKDKACNVCSFIDDDKAKQGTYVNGIKVVSLEEISRDTEDIILVCLPNPMTVYDKLKNMNYRNVKYYPVMMSERHFYDTSLLVKNQDSIEKVYGMLADDFSKAVFKNILKHRATMDYTYMSDIISQKQYFPSDIFELNERECFVDGGVYDGETIAAFVEAAKNSFDYIYGFEPDLQNYNKIKENIKNIDSSRLRLFNSGLYSKTGEIAFNSNGNSASFISETGKDIISLISLDEAVEEHIPTYIKLDIEGAEKEALYGMKNTILNYHPKLAVSVYHKAADLWELPLIISNMSPSYKIYIRHYSDGLHETVCYAV
ncbi:FkbM family methyltransferase [Ruminiclostridium sufflavum DSM 19573]|uniref:FkbM family methyltransferase n=1 Tax=Ruminiclostridium sufflavum DSM 19573 TaxID=1121337 RepID=A0A318XTW4_9FIRM|nr:FkbM family methyltransferase [Ruminiclostridium sufflavum]PYG85782.1 FkbM family methyltransferase [Ruminiclostridium sufflavum DSM 19573]